MRGYKIYWILNLDTISYSRNFKWTLTMFLLIHMIHHN